MTNPEESTAVVLVDPPGALADFGMINADREVAKREAFHDFINRVLVDGKHYGKVPGVDKKFLWQSGAEEIVAAMGCRPSYDVVEKELAPHDLEGSWIIARCTLIHVASGLTAGEAIGVSSADDFRETHRKAASGDPCPWDNSKRRYSCGVKGKHGDLPSFNVLAHNMVMRANKRAFVAAARTLGCASEIFTQDEDMVTSQPDAAPQQQRPASKSGQKAGGRQQPPTKAPEQPKEEPSQDGISADDIRGAFASIKEAEITPVELRGWAEDKGYLAPGATLNASIVLAWRDANPEKAAAGIGAFVKDVLDVLGPGEEDEASEPEAVEGEVVFE